jgi:hypothetical protein
MVLSIGAACIEDVVAEAALFPVEKPPALDSGVDLLAKR